MGKSQNPIAVRSREMLRQAMLELMAKKPYEEITVTELCRHAQLGRKTFYRNYTDKDEVLSDYLEELADGFVKALERAAPFDDQTFALTMFRYWRPHAELFCLVGRSGQSRFLMRQFDRVSSAIGGWFACPEELVEDAVFQRYCEPYVEGGCHQMLRAWMLGGAKESPEEMTRAFCLIRRLGA